MGDSGFRWRVSTAEWRVSTAEWRASTAEWLASTAEWRKSAASGPTGGQCVEVGNTDQEVVAVRDTTDRDGVILGFPVAAWRAFTADLKSADAAD